MEKTGELTQKEGYVEVSRTVIGQPSTTKNERLSIRPFITDTATVGMKYGSSLEFGKAKFEVFVSIPCYVEELPEALKQVKDFITKIAEQEMTELSGTSIPDTQKPEENSADDILAEDAPITKAKKQRKSKTSKKTESEEKTIEDELGLSEESPPEDDGNTDGNTDGANDDNDFDIEELLNG